MSKSSRIRRTENLPLNNILQGDCIKVMDSLPENSVDLIFADPPYNLQLGEDLIRPDQSKVSAVDEDWDKFSSNNEYKNFTVSWLKAARRVLKDDGAIWVMGSYHNIYNVGAIMQELEYWFLNDIIWRKANPMPNFRGTRFTNAHETLLWCSKKKESKYTFNYESMKSFNDDLQMRSDWILPICTGKERLRDDKNRKLHPTQKPESLLYRVIISSSKENDVILDPFFGTGTTGAVAKKLGRNFIGIEKDNKYIKYANKRIDSIVKDENSELFKPTKKILPPRVPFGNLLESGMLNVGDILSDKRGQIKAVVKADATININDEFTGSIHKAGAYIQETKTCNGWKFWYLNKNGVNKPIDALREHFLKSKVLL